MHRHPLVLLTLLATALAPLGCNEGDPPAWVPPDRGVPRDFGEQFMIACVQDSDCASGHCLPMGTSKRCSKRCSSNAQCPSLGGWSCGALSICVCHFAGKEPNLCNVDGDCDGQADREVKPETCNKEDDDCSGTVDDVKPGTEGATLYYGDKDGDGFGDQNAALWSCTPPAGHVTNNTDCNDGRKDVNPQAVEVCGDDIDHDCDGFKNDSDLCGLLPIVVGDVTDPATTSATLKKCDATPGVDASLDITEIVAKQDAKLIKFTVRLAGAPALAVCSTYVLRLGTFAKVYDMAYLYRPATVACGTGLPELTAYLKGAPVATSATVGFNAASPGHVSFTIPKSEYLPSLTTPTYYLKACSNAMADAVKDITDCTSDSCETPVRRE